LLGFYFYFYFFNFFYMSENKIISAKKGIYI